MAEEEKIVHHAKEAVHALANKNKKLKEKIKDFLLEILIIIIAVSITLWFHNWNDERHERAQEKDFLIGIRNDLLFVEDALSSGNKEYQSTLDYYDTLWQQIITHNINDTFINYHSGQLINTSYFNYDNSRFEGFKSSGYLRIIENKKLLNDLTRLYTVALPNQAEADEMIYNDRRRDYTTYIGSKVGTDSSGNSKITDLVNDNGFRWQVYWQKNILQENKRHKMDLLNRIKKVIPEINKELKDRFDYDVSDKK